MHALSLVHKTMFKLIEIFLFVKKTKQKTVNRELVKLLRSLQMS